MLLPTVLWPQPVFSKTFFCMLFSPCVNQCLDSNPWPHNQQSNAVPTVAPPRVILPKTFLSSTLARKCQMRVEMSGRYNHKKFYITGPWIEYNLKPFHWRIRRWRRRMWRRDPFSIIYYKRIIQNLPSEIVLIKLFPLPLWRQTNKLERLSLKKFSHAWHFWVRPGPTELFSTFVDLLASIIRQG